MSIYKKRKRTPENFKPADCHAYRKVETVNLKILRSCLGTDCGKSFIAPTKTTRLCETCRKFS
jgi:hypothetical protein